MFNPKMESRNKKISKSLPKPYVSFVYCCCALKYHGAVKCLIGGHEVVFGECGRECVLGPGNTELPNSSLIFHMKLFDK